MRKVSRAQEQMGGLNYRTAAESVMHSCDVGDHKVPEDVRCVTAGCEHRGKSWDGDNHQDWDHDYACPTHYSEVNFKTVTAGFGDKIRNITTQEPAPASQETIDRQNRSVVVPDGSWPGVQHEFTRDGEQGNRCTTCGRSEQHISHDDYFARALTNHKQRQVRLPSTEDTNEIKFVRSEASKKEEHEDHYKYIKKQGDSWVVIQKGTGKVLSHHDSREKAIASFKAMMMNKHGMANPVEPYRHPVSGTGLCGKADGCSTCGALLPAALATHSMPLHVDGESHEAFMSRTSGMISALGSLSAHLCDGGNGVENVAHGHIQHIAGMGDLAIGRIKTAQDVATAMGGAHKVPSAVKSALNSSWGTAAPEQLRGYSDGKGGSTRFDKVNWLGKEASSLKPIE